MEKCKRGMIIYARESLNTVSTSLQEEGNFEESVWCRVKLKNDDVLTLGVIYRSPVSRPRTMGDRLRSLIHEANNLKSSRLLIMGDFNSSVAIGQISISTSDIV